MAALEAKAMGDRGRAATTSLLRESGRRCNPDRRVRASVGEGIATPYKSITDLPKGVKGLPKHAQEIYRGAFNSAETMFRERGFDLTTREMRSSRVAWGAVKKSYEKDSKTGAWMAKKKKAKD